MDANRVNMDSVQFACRCTEQIVKKEKLAQEAQRDILQHPKGNRKTSCFLYISHSQSFNTASRELLSVPPLSWLKLSQSTSLIQGL